MLVAMASVLDASAASTVTSLEGIAGTVVAREELLTSASVVALMVVPAVWSIIAALVSLSSAATVGFTEDGLEEAALSATA
jgi:hypothetical protein